MKVLISSSLVLFCLVFSLPNFSADLNNIVAGIQKHYAHVTTLSASFIQVYQERNGKIFRESG